MNLKLGFLAIVGLFCTHYSMAQNSSVSSNAAPQDSAFIEISGLTSSDVTHNPFWLHTNQWGTVPTSGRGGSLRVGWQGTNNLSSKSDGLRVISGFEAVENVFTDAKFLLPEVYAGLRWKNLELFAGRRKQQVGLADSTLGTGSYATSPNAMPHYKIQFGFYEFTNIPFTNGWVQFKAFYSDGFLDKNRAVTSDLKLHQKQLYFKIGRPSGSVSLYGGFNHQAQWGGKSPYFFNAKDPDNKQMPNSFSSYLNMVMGVRGAPSPDHHDSTNRIGNHLGTIDVGMEIKTYGANLLFYRQSVYEDGSLITLINIADGLNGVRIRKNNIYGNPIEVHEAVFEFLYTKSQGGRDFEISEAKKRGRDNYYNNYQIRDGWSYQNRTMGTPFITPATATRHLGQQYLYGDSFTNNNRVWAMHMGLKGAIANKWHWTTKLSYSRNFGTYDMEENWPVNGLGQFSGMINLRRNVNFLGGTIISGTFGADMGDLYPTSYGAMLSLRKKLFF